MAITHIKANPLVQAHKNNRYKDIVQKIFSIADINLDGQRPHDIQVKNEGFYRRFLKDGRLAMGESYMDGWWECDRIDQMVDRLISANIASKMKKSPKVLLSILLSKLIREGRKSQAFEIAKRHYNIGNDIFQSTLDKRMQYTCGYWKGAHTLDEAQENKLDLVCRKLDLKLGMRVLDIGCGWGGFAKFAAEKYGVEVVGVTVSEEQAKLAREICAGLPVEVRLQDYREIQGQFDRTVVIGMIEHVGVAYYRVLMEVVHRNLAKDGLFLLHTIGRNTSLKSIKQAADPWVVKYIFPRSLAPSAKQIAEAFDGLFVMEDWHNFGVDYDKTLLSWFENFERNWDTIKMNYDERFFRMWKYYLLQCAGAFRSRSYQLWQIVLSKKGISGGYQRIS